MRSTRFYGDLSITLFTALIYSMNRKRSETKDFDQIYNAARERQPQRNAIPVSLSPCVHVCVLNVHRSIWCENILSLFTLSSAADRIATAYALQSRFIASIAGEASIIVACFHFFAFMCFDFIEFTCNITVTKRTAKAVAAAIFAIVSAKCHEWCGTMSESTLI